MPYLLKKTRFKHGPYNAIKHGLKPSRIHDLGFFSWSKMAEWVAFLSKAMPPVRLLILKAVHPQRRQEIAALKAGYGSLQPLPTGDGMCCTTIWMGFRIS